MICKQEDGNATTQHTPSTAIWAFWTQCPVGELTVSMLRKHGDLAGSNGLPWPFSKANGQISLTTPAGAALQWDDSPPKRNGPSAAGTSITFLLCAEIWQIRFLGSLNLNAC